MIKRANLVKVFVVMVVVFISVFMLVKAYGADPKYLGVVAERENGDIYKITTLDPQKTIWKIASYDSMASTTPRYNEAIYCLNPAIGFGSLEIEEKREYNHSFNMKDLTGVDAEYRGIIANNYNEILWILDNMYLPKHMPATERAEMKALLFEQANITRDVLTDNDIEVAQQLALWYFTTSDVPTDSPYHFEPGDFPSIAVNGTSLEQIDKDPDKIGEKRNSDMVKLYTYLINSAKANGTSYGTGDVRGLKAPVVEFVKPAVTGEMTASEKIGGVDYFVAGPFNFDETEGTTLPYNIEGVVLDQTDTEIATYKLLDTNKTEIAGGKITEDLLGQDFYIAVPKSGNDDITKIKLKINLTYFETKATVWTHDSNYAAEQPVVIVEKEKKDIEIETHYNISRDFDLALKKFITDINDDEITTRIPVVDVTGLKNGTSTTATYTHPKNPILVETGDIVTYTIRIYNEGEVDGYAKEITDNVPEGLKFLPTHATNVKYGWQEVGTKVTTDYLSKTKSEARGEDNLIKAFDKENGTELDFRDVLITFEVIEPNTSNKILINTAEISDDEDKDGNAVNDIDSTPDNNILTEDDIDQEFLVLRPFDLALRKFITKVNEEEITTRIPVVDVTGLKNGTSTTAEYTHPKDPVGVRTGDIVVYTIRVYNEGEVDGYAKEITDNIPEGLKFLINHPVNIEYRWKLSTDETKITTDYLSREKDEANLLLGFDPDKMETLHYKDVQVAFEVIEPNTSKKILVNTAEISDDSDADGNETEDIDSTPDNNILTEDDIDQEFLKLEPEFDLALRKFITKVNEEEIITRIPEVKIDVDFNLTYEHPKDPVVVSNNYIVTYTIRVYNEGEMAGYAKEITDDIPKGLRYLPEHETNKKYGWEVSADKTKVSTNYLSKEKSEERGENNLLNPFDKTKGVIDTDVERNPDYRDVKITFIVTEENLPGDRIITNTAEITNDEDENGDEVEDVDSEPDNWTEGEDDIDEEHLIVRYFDLSLLKWVTKVIITENGETTIRETGHTGLENPEPVVKVDLDKKDINKITVKFAYTIKITNEGQIAGYAKEITDYIPTGLRFEKADNPKWEEKEPGKIVTTELENTLLQPGETAEVEVILTWINDSENMGVMTNIAEISKDHNDDGAPDIDSTPDNKVPGEDDIDDAPVMLTVKTGGIIIYTGLTTIILAMLGGGVYLIKRYVL